jgi:hypothetical protein
MDEEIVSLPVPDDLLVEIFLRLPTPADILRASATCVSFRRVAAHRAIVRRFRKLNARPLLGFFDDRVFDPAILPHPSAPAACAFALAADFSFSFLPARTCAWVVQDSCDGHILLKSAETDEAIFSEVLVCDPLHRRYLFVPPVPDDIAASVENPLPIKPRFWCQTFLVPLGDDEDAPAAEEMPFRVICLVLCKTKLFAFVFSSSTGQWRAIPSQGCNNLFAGLLSSGNTVFRFRQYVYGSFYWRTGYAETSMLVLDTRRMEFSIAELPPEAKSSYSLAIAMVEAGKSRPGFFMLKDSGSTLSYCIMQKDAGSLGHWQEQKTISLGRGHYLIGSTERYLLLFRLRSSSDGPGFYTLDVKTFHLEKVCDSSTSSFLNLHAYSNFPPSLLSLPTIPRGKFSVTS